MCTAFVGRAFLEIFPYISLNYMFTEENAHTYLNFSGGFEYQHLRTSFNVGVIYWCYFSAQIIIFNVRFFWLLQKEEWLIQLLVGFLWTWPVNKSFPKLRNSTTHNYALSPFNFYCNPLHFTILPNENMHMKELCLKPALLTILQSEYCNKSSIHFSFLFIYFVHT